MSSQPPRGPGSTATATAATTLRSEPLRDGFATAALGQRAIAHLFWQRCAEAHAQGAPSQDYALLRSAGEGGAICFCVADGVGSSYRGDFAAQYLATRLTSWLERLPPLPLPPPETVAADALAGELRSHLAAWCLAAQAMLRRLPFAAETPALVREVLEELRESYGSEAVFLAGRLEVLAASTVARETAGEAPSMHQESQVPHVPSVRALLCWMGNVAAQAAGTTGESDESGVPGAAGAWQTLNGDDDRARWSSARGLRGALSVRLLTFPLPCRLLVYTDGAAALPRERLTAPGAALEASARELLARPTSDDITILDLQCLAPELRDEECAERSEPPRE